MRGANLRLPSVAGRRKSAAARAAARRDAFAAYFAEAAVRRVALAAVSLVPNDPAGLVRDRLCGLPDGQGGGLGLGLIQAPACDDGAVTLLTPVAVCCATALVMGDLRLALDGRELERLR